MSIRTLIVDDEPLARERIRTLLEGDPDIELLGEEGGGHEAVAAILELRPDLVFLDIQMPELDGFGVLASLEPDQLPVVVFVTAHDQYALKAFDVHALDYLLKPFDRERFQQALARGKARARKDATAALGSIERLLSSLDEQRTEYVRRLTVKSRGKAYFVHLEQVDWIEATGNYVTLHTSDKTHMVRGTMRRLEQILDPARFVRVHRSAIVSMDRIESVEPSSSGDYVLTLRGGGQVTSGETYRGVVQELMKNPL